MPLQRTRGLAAAQFLRFAGPSLAVQHHPVRRSPLNAVALGHAAYRLAQAAAALAVVGSLGCTSAQHRDAPSPPVLRYQGSDGSWREDLDGVVGPVLLTRIGPSWPEQLRTRANTGTVVLHVLVSREGFPEDLRITQSVSEVMDQEAVRTVKQWRYRPATLAGEPVPVWAEVKVEFHLY